MRLWWLTQETTPPILDDLCSGVCLSGCVFGVVAQSSLGVKTKDVVELFGCGSSCC